jgi:hypothetical protein
MLEENLLSIFMDVYNDTLCNLSGCGADKNRQIEVLSGIQAAFGRKLCPFIGSMKSAPASRAVPRPSASLHVSQVSRWDADIAYGAAADEYGEEPLSPLTQAVNASLSYETKTSVNVTSGPKPNTERPRKVKCNICLSDVDVTDNGPSGNHHVTGCCHHFHKICMVEMEKAHANMIPPPGEPRRALKCPTCRTPL